MNINKLFNKIKKPLILTLILAAVILVAALMFWFLKDRMLSRPIPSATPRANIFSAPPEISSVEELFKYDPGANANPADVVDYTFLVSREAVSTNSITLSDCLPEPAVVRVLTGKTLVFENKDSQSHRLSSSDWNVEVPANGSAKLDVKVSDVHEYTCDGQRVGILFIPY